MKHVVSIVMVIIGALIGAGFASGQEIYVFFYKYGVIGIAGIFISTTLISVCTYRVLLSIKTGKINNYKEFLSFYLDKPNKKLLNIINSTLNILLLITFFIMISGFGAYFNQEYHLNSIIGSAVLAGICFIVFNKDIDKFVRINKYMVPILIIVIIFIGILNFENINIYKNNINLEITNIFSGLMYAVIYASYNLILLIPVLIALKDKLKKENKIKFISIYLGVLVLILSIIIYFLLNNINGNIEKIEMPAVFAIKKEYNYLTNIYGLIILISIFTTAISLGISFLENVTKNKKNYSQIAAIMCITSVIFSRIGFSNLIKILYPVFGIIGLLQIYIILKKRY